MKINQFFNQITQINESKRVNKQEMFSFITKNINIVNEFDLQKVYERALIDVIKKETGYYLSDRMGSYEIQEFPREKIDRLMTYDETMKRIKELEKEYSNNEISIEQRKIIKRFDHILGQSTYEGKGIFKMFGYYSGYSNLIDLLIYIITGKIQNDLRMANDINDKYFKDNMIGRFKIEELDNIEIQTFKNGKVKIKNFNNKWDQKTTELYETYKKFRYNN